jgi:hypothetical protein
MIYYNLNNELTEAWGQRYKLESVRVILIILARLLLLLRWGLRIHYVFLISVQLVLEESLGPVNI